MLHLQENDALKQPHSYPNRVLVLVSGLAPQIITETIYALAIAEQPAFVPTEVHLITTREGAERARLLLLTESPGWFHRLREEYQLPAIKFDRDTIHTIDDDQGAPLPDIRNLDDNRRAADFITDKIRHFSSDPDTALHVSIAGGRKTMGFYAGYALSLFGRPQDRLSHVLVDSEYEGNTGFFYPNRDNTIITTAPPDNRPLDTSKATVSLAYIPFVRVREGMPEQLLNGTFSFNDTVNYLQSTLMTPRLQIDLNERTMWCGGHQVDMAPAEFAFYTWLALRKVDERPPIRWTDEGLADEYIDHYGRIHGAGSGLYDRLVESLQQGFSKEYFEQRKSKTNSALKAAMGEQAAAPYLIAASGKKPERRFGIHLPATQILIEGY